MNTTAILVAEALLAVTAILAVCWFFLRRRRAEGLGAPARPSDLHGPGGTLIERTLEQEDWLSLAREMAAAWLVVTEGPGYGAHHMLLGGTNVIGRGSARDIRLSDPTISRQHARLAVSGDRFLLYDLQSASGALVGGEEVDQSTGALLKNGAVVQLGATSLVFMRVERGFEAGMATAAGKRRS